MVDLIAHHMAAAETHLQQAQRALGDEMSAYPTPISGCDAQFNHLLSLRSQIGAALDALNTPAFVPTPRMPVPADRLESR